MVRFTSTLAGVVLAYAAVTVAHPGHDIQQEAKERRDFMQHEHHARALEKCAAKLDAIGHTRRAVERRQALAERLRERHQLDSGPYLKARDVVSVLGTSHHSNITGITSPDVDDSVLFSDNSSCIVQPDVTEGPYYVTGELIRSDITEGQEGVTLYLDVQFVDVSNCEPISGIYVDVWHANSSGVYSGVVANGNGNAADATNIDNTAFRGIQQTDSDGVVKFTTRAPGHYSGRTNHIHILSHSPDSLTVYPNGTLGTNSLLATHVGQLFLDQDLIYEYEAVEPYASNTQSRTTNAQDGILAQEANTEDPMLEYVFLGDSVSDGILGWATVGVDTTNNVTVNNAAYYGEDGGEATGNGGGGPGGPPPASASASAGAKF